jgi:hypothetical protein
MSHALVLGLGRQLELLPVASPSDLAGGRRPTPAVPLNGLLIFFRLTASRSCHAPPEHKKGLAKMSLSGATKVVAASAPKTGGMRLSPTMLLSLSIPLLPSDSAVRSTPLLLF